MVLFPIELLQFPNNSIEKCVDLINVPINNMILTVGNCNFIDNLSRYLFWDYNVSMLDPNMDKTLILERVFTRGTENDEKEVFNYYGKNIIKDTVLDVKYIDKKTLNYLSIILDVPKENFKCYEKSLLENPFGISKRITEFKRIFYLFFSMRNCIVYTVRA